MFCIKFNIGHVRRIGEVVSYIAQCRTKYSMSNIIKAYICLNLKTLIIQCGLNFYLCKHQRIFAIYKLTFL